MTDDRNPDALSLAALEALARAHGYAFSHERLVAALPEVRRLRELVRRLQALPLDEEFPAMRSDLE